MGGPRQIRPANAENAASWARRTVGGANLLGLGTSLVDEFGVLSTPPLPDWIKGAEVRGYVAAHRVVAGERRLYGTETLFGDWGGEVLLLAKDWGPARILRERMARGEASAWRHDPRMRANRRLVKLAAECGVEPGEHGALYGSALANLLREDGRVSGALPNRAEALEYGVEVLRFVRAHMPALATVVCMGREAWECAATAFGGRGEWREVRDGRDGRRDGRVGWREVRDGRRGGRKGAEHGELELLAAWHPSARVSWPELARPWRALRERAA
jgi:hypothetical protein